jgi:ribosomal protein L19E
MMLDDGCGTVIETDSRPMSLRKQVEVSQSKLIGLRKALRENERVFPKTRELRRQHQEIKNSIDIETVNYKKLYKKYERDIAASHTDYKGPVETVR